MAVTPGFVAKSHCLGGGGCNENVPGDDDAILKIAVVKQVMAPPGQACKCGEPL